jgi:hypothetical protein
MKALTDSINRSGGRWLKRLTVQPAAVGGVRDQAARLPLLHRHAAREIRHAPTRRQRLNRDRVRIG